MRDTADAADTPAPAAAKPYPSLEQLRVEHADLLRRRRTTPDGLADAVAEFIERGRATGAFLAADADREAAQTLVTYWATALYRLRGEGEAVADELAEYDHRQSPELPDSAYPYARLDQLPPDKAARAVGWERLLAEALAAVDSERVVVVVGPPNGGREELVHGGLVPILRTRPGGADREYLVPIAAGGDPLAELFKRLGPGMAAGRPRPVLLVVDRFDDLVASADPVRAREFADQLFALVTDPAVPHRVVLTMGPEGAPGPACGPFADHLRAGQVPVAFTPTELRAMVEEPAARAGLVFDAGLVDRLLADVQGDPVPLALLRFALRHVWAGRRGNRATHEAYDAVRGGRLGLGRQAERVFAGLPGPEWAAARAMLLRLVLPAPGAGVVRRYVRGEDLVAAAPEACAAARALEQLEQNGLVVRPPTGDPEREEYVAAHDGVATAWPECQRWLDDVREDQRWWFRLRTAALLWQKRGHRSADLWTGAVLEVALAKLREPGPAAEPPEPLDDEFLRQSRLRDRLNRAAWWSAVAAVGVGVVTGLTLYGLYQKAVRVAKEQEVLRQNNTIALQEQAQVALDREKKLATLDAVDWQLLAGAGLDQRGDPAGAFVWSAEAWTQFRTAKDARPEDQDRLDANHRTRLGVAWRDLGRPKDLAYHHKALQAATTPDGKLVLTVGEVEGATDKRASVRVWRAGPDGRWKATDLAPPGGGARGPDAKAAYLLRAGDDDIAVVPFRDGQDKKYAVCSWRWPRDGDPAAAVPVRSQEFAGRFKSADVGRAPAGDHLAVVSQDDADGQAKCVVRVWAAGAAAPTLLHPPADACVLGQVAFSPAADRLAVVVEAGECDAAALEWRVDRPADAPHRYAPDGPRPDRGALAEATAAAYGPAAGGRQWLFVSRGTEVNAPPDAWLFPVGPRGGERPVPLPAHHAGPVYAAAFDPAGARLATAGEDGRVRLWALDPLDPRNQFTFGPMTARMQWRFDKPVVLAHDARAFFVQFAPDGRRVVTASRDRRAVVWDAATGRPVGPDLYHPGTVYRAEFTPDGADLLTLTGELAYRWAAPAGPGGPSFAVPGPVRSVVAGDDGRFLVAVPESSANRAPARAVVFDTKAKTRYELPPGHARAAVGPAGTDLLASVGPDGAVEVRRASADGVLGRPDAGGQEAVFVALGGRPAAPLLVAVLRAKGKPTGDAVVRAWALDDRGAATPRGEFAFRAPLTAAVVGPDGKRVVAYSEERDRGVAVLWDVGSPQGQALRRKDVGMTHTERITTVAFDAAGDRVLTTGEDDEAVVWSRGADGWAAEYVRAADRPDRPHTADVLAAAFAPDGGAIVTAGADRRAFVWHGSAGRSETALPLDAKPAAVALTRDGSRALTVGEDGTLRLWDAADGRPVAAARYPGRVWRAALADDGRAVRVVGAVESAGGATEVYSAEWNLAPATEAELADAGTLARVRAARAVDGIRLSPLTAKAVFEQWSKLK